MNGVDKFIVMDSLIFEYTDSMNMIWISSEYRVSMYCLFRLSVRAVGRWDEHAGSVAELVVSFGRPASEQWTRWANE